MGGGSRERSLDALEAISRDKNCVIGGNLESDAVR